MMVLAIAQALFGRGLFLSAWTAGRKNRQPLAEQMRAVD